LNKKQLNAILMVLILLIAVPFLPLLAHRSSEQFRYDDTEADSYPGESGVESGVDREENWEDMNDDERDDKLQDWAKDLPPWLRDLVEEHQGDLDNDGIPNIEDPDIDGDGIPNDEDDEPAKSAKTNYDNVNIDNFYNGDNKDELEQTIFRITPVSPAKYWKVRSLERYDISEGSNRWSSSIKAPTKKGPFSPDVGAGFAYTEHTYNLVFEATSNEDDYIPTAQHTIRVYNTNPADDDVIRVNREGDFYTRESLKSYSFDVYDYNFTAPDLYSFELTKAHEPEVEKELEVPGYFTDDRRKEYAVSELATNLTRNHGSQFNKTMAIVAYLKNNYTYNFKTYPSPVKEDPVYWFLFERRDGVCTNFASAFVMLCRLSDIPARLAIGFALGTVDEASGVRVIKANNAHAWGEVYFGDMGWIPFEPTSSNVDNDNGGDSDGWDEDIPGGGDGGWTTDGDAADSDYDKLPDEEELALGTDPLHNDTDRDGIGDGDEVIGTLGYVTDPLSNDTDDDGLSDLQEHDPYLTNPTDPDTDEDGISDLNETQGFMFKLGNDNNNEWTTTTTDPTRWDSDGDGLHDGLEIGLTLPQTLYTKVDSSLGEYFYPDSDDTTTTHPMLADTDGDNLTDGEEDANRNGRWDPDPYHRSEPQGETNPYDPDTDGGGAWDGTERAKGGDPTSDHDDAAYIDTDGDELSDAEELAGWYVTYINETGEELSYHTSSNISNTDTDGDGLSDYYERWTGYRGDPTDPNSSDTDRDGLGDGNESWEITVHKRGGTESWPVEASPLEYNSDTDGLNDFQEKEKGTDPKNNDTDGDNPPGKFILDDHLDKHPTTAAYEYVETSIDIHIDKRDMWKANVTGQVEISGKLNGTKNTGGDITVVTPAKVKVRLYLADIDSNLSELDHVSRTIATLESDEAGEFVFSTDFEDVPVGVYILWGRVLVTYGSQEQYNSSVSNLINITISSEASLSLSAPSTVANESELRTSARLRDKGGFPLPVEGLELTFSWKNDEHTETIPISPAGRAYFQHHVNETSQEYYRLKVEFPGYQGGYYVESEGRWLNYTIGSAIRSEDIEVLSSDILMNVTAPAIVPVNQSFESNGTISAGVNDVPVNLSGTVVQATLDNEVIGEGTIQDDSSFTMLCSFDQLETKPGHNTLRFVFPGSREIGLAEHWELHPINIAGRSNLDIIFPETVERPENITISGELSDNRGEAIPGHAVGILCKGIDTGNATVITDEKGEFRFHLPISETHALSHLPFTVYYKGYGYYGENETNKETTVVNYFPAQWNGSITVITTVELTMNGTELVRAENNTVTFHIESLGNHTIVRNRTLYFSFNDELVGELVTDNEGAIETTLFIPAEERPGTASITIEFPGDEFIKGSELRTVVQVFTRTRMLMTPSSEFRPLVKDSPFTIKGQVENTTEPLRSIGVSLYVSSRVEDADEVLEAYREHGGDDAGNPFASPLETELLSFPEDFRFIGTVYTNYYGNFSSTITIDRKASPGRFFIHALFNGTEFYYSSRNLIFVDIKANTTLLMGASTTPFIGKEMSLTLTLLDDLNAPLTGKEVSVLYLPSKDDLSRTRAETEGVLLDTTISDINGTLTLTPFIPLEMTKGERTLRIVFPGDLFYEPSRYTLPVTIYMESHFQMRFVDEKNRTILPKQLLEEHQALLDSTGEGNGTPPSLEGRRYIKEGEKIRCTITLLDIYDNPIPYKKIDIHINGNLYRSVYLDDNASYEISMTVNEGVSGSFIIQAIYKGGADVAGNATRMDVELREGEDQGFFSSWAGILVIVLVAVAVAGGAYLTAFRKEEEFVAEELPEDRRESNRRLIIKEYNRFVDFMRYYGFRIGHDRTAREIIDESDRGILITKEDLTRITEIFERARYKKLSSKTRSSHEDSPATESTADDAKTGEKEGTAAGAKGADTDDTMLWPTEGDVEELRRLIRKIEDDIEVENIPLKTGEAKFTDGIFDRAKSIHDRVTGLMNGKEK